jgi:hypothetical protein
MTLPVNSILRLFPPRREIIWLGARAPIALEAECIGRAMRVIPHSGELTDELLARSRGIVIPVSAGTDVETLRVVIGRARSHGLLSALATSDDISPEAYASVARAVAGNLADRVIAKYSNWLEFAHEIDGHDPGPGHHEVELLGDRDDLSPEAALLLQRAFSDVAAVELNTLKAGKSGCGVRRVVAQGAGSDNVPHSLLAKLGPLEKIREERAKYNAYIARRAHWLHVPGLVHDRYTEGDQLGLLVQHFVDGALSLAHALEIVPPGPVIANLFDVALGGCHGKDDNGVGHLGHTFADLKVLKLDRPALVAAAGAARALRSDLPSITDLQATWDALPNMAYRRGVVHADLHTGNVFARANSSDVIVIDFTNAAFGPVVADHACLEVSLIFPICEDVDLSTSLPNAWLESAYIHPLLPTALPGAVPGVTFALLNSIRAVRTSAMATERFASVYTLAVAAYLLRFASFDDQAMARRRVAYDMSCRLITAVATEGKQ